MDLPATDEQKTEFKKLVDFVIEMEIKNHLATYSMVSGGSLSPYTKLAIEESVRDGAEAMVRLYERYTTLTIQEQWNHGFNRKAVANGD